MTMTTQPTVSVCIANYNGVTIIADCVDSVIAQQGEISIEILVHDDASTDGSVAFIEEHYPQIELIISPENVGFCTANNRMAGIARGKYLLLLNNDATLFPDAISTLFSEAENLPQPAILGLPQYDAGSGQLLDIGSLLDPFLNPVPNLNRTRQDVGMIMGSCLWIPKSLWDELGGFPEWFGSIGEDLCLCCRARLAGYPVRAVGYSGYRHQVGASFGGGKMQHGKLSTTRRRRALSERNKTFVMLMCYPWLLLVLILPLHLILLYFEGLLLTLVKRDVLLWHEIYAPLLPTLWHERKQLLESRQTVQKKRRTNLVQFLAVFIWMPHKLRMLLRHGLPEVT